MNFEFTPIIFLIIGIILCFCGYKIQKILITFAWFLIGFNISSILLGNIISNETTVLIASLAVGLILAILGIKIERLAVYIAVAYLSYKALSTYLVFDNETATYLINGVISLIIGALSVKLIRPIIIIVSSIYGTSLVTSNLPHLLNIPSIGMTIITIFLIIISIIYQLSTTKD